MSFYRAASLILIGLITLHTTGLINASGGEVATSSSFNKALTCKCKLCSCWTRALSTTPRDCVLPRKHHVCNICLEKVSGNGLLLPTERSCPLCIFSITAKKFEDCDFTKIKKSNGENIRCKKNGTGNTCTQFTLYTEDELLSQRGVFSRYLAKLHTDLLTRQIISGETACAFNPHTVNDEDFRDHQFMEAVKEVYFQNLINYEKRLRHQNKLAREEDNKYIAQLRLLEKIVNKIVTHKTKLSRDLIKKYKEFTALLNERKITEKERFDRQFHIFDLEIEVQKCAYILRLVQKGFVGNDPIRSITSEYIKIVDQFDLLKREKRNAFLHKQKITLERWRLEDLIKDSAHSEDDIKKREARINELQEELNGVCQKIEQLQEILGISSPKDNPAQKKVTEKKRDDNDEQAYGGVPH